MAKIVIVVGHPRGGSFCEALGEAYAAGARAAGHEVEILRLSALDFDAAACRGFDRETPLEPDLQRAQAALGAAGHSVWIWPIWLGFPPAMLKGFLERVLTEGFAIERLRRPPFYRPLLTGRSARVIVTMEMPAWMFILLAGSRAARTFSKQVLGFVGIAPVRRSYFGLLGHVGEAKRRKYLAKAEALGRKGA